METVRLGKSTGWEISWVVVQVETAQRYCPVGVVREGVVP